MVVLLSHRHHIGNGGAFITRALRFIVIAITIHHVCDAFITWAYVTIFNVMVVLLSHGHHVGNGGASRW
eukprot:scaffold105549_cov56-Cyclotella_meneghiniana.AAC.1